MTDEFLFGKILKLLEDAEFMNLATVDAQGRPCAANKFLLKQEPGVLYIVDFIRGMTWNNLRHNPYVSLTIMDKENLVDYQINGSVEIIEEGPVYENLIKELKEKDIRFSTNRIIEGVRRAKAHDHHEFLAADNAVVIKVNIKEVIGLGPSAELKR